MSKLPNGGYRPATDNPLSLANIKRHADMHSPPVRFRGEERQQCSSGFSRLNLIHIRKLIHRVPIRAVVSELGTVSRQGWFRPATVCGGE